MHHILKSCVVVFLTARDEASCFTIFSTLNGRGVDLAVVDKLKPELLQVSQLSVTSAGGKQGDPEDLAGGPSHEPSGCNGLL